MSEYKHRRIRLRAFVRAGCVFVTMSSEKAESDGDVVSYVKVVTASASDDAIAVTSFSAGTTSVVNAEVSTRYVVSELVATFPSRYRSNKVRSLMSTSTTAASEVVTRFESAVRAMESLDESSLPWMLSWLTSKIVILPSLFRHLTASENLKVSRPLSMSRSKWSTVGEAVSAVNERTWVALLLATGMSLFGSVAQSVARNREKYR